MFRVKYQLLLWILFIVIVVNSFLKAEGTKQLVPDPTKNYGQLQIWDNVSSGTRVFMTYAATNIPLKHLNIKVCNAGEKVYIGFTASNNDVFFRVKDPNGNTVPLSSVSSTSGIATLASPLNKPRNYTSLYVNAGGTVINASTTPISAPNTYTYRMGYSSGNPGYISNYNEAATGPAVPAVAAANGYSVSSGYKNPFFFIATVTGDYYLEANPVFPDSLITSGPYPTNSNRVFPFFDVAVTDAADKIQTGRVWSGFWDLTTNSYTNYFAGSFYIYTTDSIVTKLKFNNIGPDGFLVMSNSFGLTNTGSFVKDRQSLLGNFGSPEFKLFLNNPDISCYPSGVFGQLISPPYINGCNVNNRCINLNVSKGGKADIILKLSSIGLIDRYISVNLQQGSNCVLWDTKDGVGNLVPEGSNFNIQVRYNIGLTNFPVFDVENNLGGYSVTLVRPLTGGLAIPEMFWDDTQIPLVKNTSNGSLTQAATPYPSSPQIPGNWISMGGTPVPYPACGIGSSSNAASTGYSPWIDIITTSAGQCTQITNGCTTTIGCYNGLHVLDTTQGCVNTAGCHLWSWAGVKGPLTDYGSYNTINMWWYANILTTSVGINSGYITANSETRISRINGKVPDTTICANNNVYKLNGSISSTGITGSIISFWKTALPKGIAGSFSDSTNLTSTYLPSATDLARDSTKIYLYATNSNCFIRVLDSLIIKYSPAPNIIITAPTNVCANNSTINLSSSISTAASGVTWGGSISGVGPLTGTFSPPTSFTPAYTLGVGESPSYGSPKLLIFIATTTGNGKCKPVISSQVTVTVNPAFTVSIPSTASICSSQANLLLNGNISNGITTTTGLWHTNGTGTFTGGFSTTTVLSTTYYFSSTDVINNGVTLSLISTGNGNCNASAGQIVVSMYSAPTALVVTNPTVCTNNPTATISGTVNNATSVLWSDLTGPVGTYSPSSTVLGISYTPSSAEIASQASVTLQLQAFESGCVPASSTALITIDKAPTLSPSTTQFVCANNATVTLTSSVFQSSTGEGSGAIWSGNGGTFFPSNIITPTTTGVTYTLSSTEISNGSTVLVLTSTGNKTCLPITSSVTVFVSTAPTITPLSNVNVCVNNPTVSLTGSVNSPFTGSWSTSGNGTVSGIGSTILYTASALDISNGTVPFTYATSTFDATHNIQCKSVSQTINLTFTSSPSVSAGSNITVCANNAAVTLNGAVTGATGVSWIGGTSASFSPSRNVISPTYTPTASEIAGGLLTLSITSTGNPSNCYADLKAMNIAFTPAPTVNPGSTFNVCSNNANISLNGSVIIGNVTSTGVWSGGNGGSFNPVNNVKTVYTPSSADIASGAVLFTLTPTNVGNCTPNPSSLLVGFTTPQILSFSPSIGSLGNTVTIFGNSFNGTTKIGFGADTATSFDVIDSNTITAILGYGASGNVSVYSNCGIVTIGGFIYNNSSTAPGITTFSPSVVLGDSIVVPFTVTGLFFPNNVFTLQLSDSTGSFGSPIIIGTLSGTTFGSIKGFIPSSVTGTSGYQLRVVSSSLPTTGNSINVPLSINSVLSNNSISGNASICYGSSVTLTGSVPIGGTGALSFLWKISTTSSSSGFVDASGVFNNINYTFSPASPLTTYWVLRQVISGTSTITSNVLGISVGSSIRIAGTISGLNNAVCPGSNSGTLSLTGFNGTIIGWESFTNKSSSSQYVSSSLPILFFSNLTTTTSYRTVVRNGTCPADTSNIFTVTVTGGSISGIIDGPVATQCVSANSGTLTLSGYSGTILTWLVTPPPIGSILISSPSAIYPFQNLTTTTSFQAVVINGSCAPDTSLAFVVSVSGVSFGGFIYGPTASQCSNANAGTLTLSGYNGNIIYWQSSTDNFQTINPISSSFPVYSFSNLTTTTSFNAVVQSGTCPSTSTGIFTVSVTGSSIGGTISGPSGTLCPGVNSGTLTLTGSLGNVVGWTSSTDNFATGQVIPNPTFTYAFSNLTSTTGFNAVVQNGNCPPAISSSYTALITPSNPGIVTGPTAPLCNTSNSGTLFLIGNAAPVIRWESTLDNSTFSPLNDTTFSYTFSSLSTTTGFRAVVQLFPCPTLNSNLFTVTVSSAPIAGILSGGGTLVADGANSGTLQLNNYSGDIIHWDKSKDSSMSSATYIANTSSQLDYAGLTSAEYYRAVVKTPGCPSIYSNVVGFKFAQIKIFTGFSPNGDGKNDAWVIENIQYYPNNKVKIYDRIGNLVYEESGYDNVTKVWKGNRNTGVAVGGDVLPKGTYYYNVTIEGQQEMLGYLMLNK